MKRILPGMLLLAAIGLSSQASTATNAGARAYPAAEMERLRAAIRRADEQGEKELGAAKMRQLRDLQARYGALDSAMATGMRLVDRGIAETDRSALAGDWLVLARMSRQAGNFPDAIAGVKRAILILKTTADEAATRAATMELLDLFLEARKLDDFKHLGESELHAYQRENNLGGQAMVRYRQGKSLCMQGKPADALPLLHQALRDIAYINDGDEAAQAQFALARAYAALGRWSDAGTAFDAGMKRAPRSLSAHPELYGLHAEILEGAGNLQQALRCLRAEAKMKDSSFSAAMTDRMARIQIMYEVRSKDKELAALRESASMANAVADSARAKARGLAWLAFGLALGLVTLVLLRLKQGHWVRRTRLRNTLIRNRADEMRAKSLELERQNLRLSHALLEDEKRREPVAGTYACGVRMLELLLEAQLQHINAGEQAAVVGSLQRRVGTMALLNEHLAKAAGHGALNLKAHFNALASSILRETGHQEQVQAVFEIDAEEQVVDNVLPLSLLYGELLRISMRQAGPSPGPFSIHMGLRRLAMNQWEFLYVDGRGGINAASLNDGSVGAALVKTLAKALRGSIVLLKDEVTAFQLTYAGTGQTELRKAS